MVKKTILNNLTISLLFISVNFSCTTFLYRPHIENQTGASVLVKLKTNKYKMLKEFILKDGNGFSSRSKNDYLFSIEVTFLDNNSSLVYSYEDIEKLRNERKKRKGKFKGVWTLTRDGLICE